MNKRNGKCIKIMYFEGLKCINEPRDELWETNEEGLRWMVI